MSQNIKSMTQAEIAQLLKDMGQPAFRAKQVYTWLHKGVTSYEQMTNLSKELRSLLAEQYPFTVPKLFASRSRKKTALSSTCGSFLTETVWKRC